MNATLTGGRLSDRMMLFLNTTTGTTGRSFPSTKAPRLSQPYFFRASNGLAELTSAVRCDPLSIGQNQIQMRMPVISPRAHKSLSLASQIRIGPFADGDGTSRIQKTTRVLADINFDCVSILIATAENSALRASNGTSPCPTLMMTIPQTTTIRSSRNSKSSSPD